VVSLTSKRETGSWLATCGRILDAVTTAACSAAGPSGVDKGCLKVALRRAGRKSRAAWRKPGD
jgi:hypothetical protein